MAVAKRKDDPIEDILNRIRSEIDRAHSSASSAECYLSDLEGLLKGHAPKEAESVTESVKLHGLTPLDAGLGRLSRIMYEKEGLMDEQATIKAYCHEVCEEAKTECLFCPLNPAYEDEGWWALLPPDNQRDEFLFSIGDRTWLYCQHVCPKVEGELLRVGAACLTCKLWLIRPVWSPESDRLEDLRQAELKKREDAAADAVRWD